MISRKEFIRQSSLFVAGSMAGTLYPGTSTDSPETLTILFTNDTHARIDPFPQNAREFAGLGGVSRRASLIKKIRYNTDHTLLLDAGDVFYGTPWFDLFGGSVDFKVMSNMGYDAMTLGDHEFTLGPEGFAEAAKEADFPFLAANYRAQNTAMQPFIQDSAVREYAGVRVGVFGIGIELDGVVSPELSGGVISFEPVRIARRSVNSLRIHHNCDYVICLSHLGYKYESDKLDDLALAEAVDGIDLIIGGHTHTFLDEPMAVSRPNGSVTWITQMGHSGIRLGRVDLPLTGSAIENNAITSRYYTVGLHE